jgi:hypothetical protein
MPFFMESWENTDAPKKHIKNDLKAIINFANYVDFSITGIAF